MTKRCCHEGIVATIKDAVREAVDDTVRQAPVFGTIHMTVNAAKPPEPTGRYAVIVDANGVEWMRRNQHTMWQRQTCGTPGIYGPLFLNYDDIAAVRVLSAGAAT